MGTFKRKHPLPPDVRHFSKKTHPSVALAFEACSHSGVRIIKEESIETWNRNRCFVEEQPDGKQSAVGEWICEFRNFLND